MRILKKLTNKISSTFSNFFLGIKCLRSKKVFCIGANKTGTTSMAKLFQQLGFIVAPQRPFELLIEDWHNNDYKKLIKQVKFKGEAFQDIPFSFPNTFKVLDENFPDSKFILTIRDSSESWYKSITSFHSKLFGNGNIPTKQDLQNAEYVYKGWIWKVFKWKYNTPEDDLYNEILLKKYYNDYNNSIIEYFKDKPNKLLVVNPKEPDAAIKICNFLETKKIIKKMPWENKT